MATRLVLFIDAEHPLGIRALDDVQRLIARTISDAYELDVKDVLKDPHDAEEFAILATPTLVRTDVTPPRRVVGDLSNIERVSRSLGLDSAHAEGL